MRHHQHQRYRHLAGIGTLLLASTSVMLPAVANPANQPSNICAATAPGTGNSPAITTPLKYFPVEPTRVLDTRDGTGVANGNPCRVAPKKHLGVAFTGADLKPPADAKAAVINITGTGATDWSWIAAYPGGTAFNGTSSVNFGKGSDAAALVTVPLGADGSINFATNGGELDIVADVVGYYAPGSADKPGSLFNSLATPTRPHNEQKTGWGSWTDFDSGLTLKDTDGKSITPDAVLANVTLAKPNSDAYLNLVDISRKATTKTSTVNAAEGLTRANKAIVTGGQKLSLFSSADTRSIVDLVGYYGKAGHGYVPVQPTRLVDTRSDSTTGHKDQPLKGGTMSNFMVRGKAGVPAAAKSVVATITAVNATRDSGGHPPTAPWKPPMYITMYPGKKITDLTGFEAKTSDLNMDRKDARANMAVIPLGADGSIDAFLNEGTSEFIVDVLGYFTDATTIDPPAPALPPEDLKTKIDTGPANGTVLELNQMPTYTFSASADNTGGSFECWVDTEKKACTNGTFTPSDLKSGDHTFMVRALNSAGEPDPKPQVRHFRVTKAFGTYPVGAKNTGVPRGVSLTKKPGNVYVTQAGEKIDSLDIHGFLVIQAPNVTITRSKIRGGVTYAHRGAIHIDHPNASNTIIRDSTIVADFPTTFLEGIKGGGFTAERLDISGVFDGIGIHKADTKIQGNWIHHLNEERYAGPTDPSAHSDGIQVHGTDNHLIFGNSITGGNNAAIQVTQDTATVSNLKINKNYMDNGSCSLNIAYKGKGAITNSEVHGNKFGRGSNNAGQPCAIIAPKTTGNDTITYENNVWADNNQPVDISTGAP